MSEPLTQKLPSDHKDKDMTSSNHPLLKFLASLQAFIVGPVPSRR